MPVQSPVANLRRQTSLIFAKISPWPPADIDEVDVGGDHENKIGEGEHHGSGHHGTSATKSEGHHTFVNFFEILFSYFDMKRPPTCPPIRAPIGIRDPTLIICANALKLLRLKKNLSRIINFLDLAGERLKISPNLLQRLTRRNLLPDKTKSIVYNYEGRGSETNLAFNSVHFCILLKKFLPLHPSLEEAAQDLSNLWRCPSPNFLTWSMLMARKMKMVVKLNGGTNGGWSYEALLDAHPWWRQKLRSIEVRNLTPSRSRRPSEIRHLCTGWGMR